MLKATANKNACGLFIKKMLKVHKVVELKRTYQITKSSSGKFYGLKQDESHEFATKLL